MHTGGRNRVSLAGILVCWLCLVTGPAVAASFDCNKATSLLEQAICADPELSRLDERMAADYRSVLAALPTTAQALVRTTQRKWLAGIRRTCTGPLAVVAHCVSNAYGSPPVVDRVDRKGPYTMRWLHADYWATTEPYIGVPLIIAPNGPSVTQWNEMVAGEAAKTVPDNEYEYVTLFGLGMVRDGFIGLRVFHEQHGLGGSGWDIAAVGTNRFLDPWRDLQADDVFDPAQNWAAALLPRVKELATQLPVGDEALLEAIRDPANWLVRDDGISVTYGNSMNRGSAELLLPWSVLRPYLAKRPAIPIPQ